MFEESFNLIQHTPIIHFKPNTSIRTTELKPALNRFISNKEHIPLEEFRKKYPFRVLINTKSIDKGKIERNMLFFWNMKNSENAKEFVYADVEI